MTNNFNFYVFQTINLFYKYLLIFFLCLSYQTTWPASWEICMQVRKQQLELDMEQQAGSK